MNLPSMVACAVLLERMCRELDAWKSKGVASEWTEGPKWYRINRQLHIDLIAEGSQVPAP